MNQAVTTRINIRDYNKFFIFTGVYGNNNRNPRNSLWRYLETIATYDTNEPYVIGGYFNLFEKTDERMGGNGIYWDQTGNFNDCIKNMLVDDLPIRDNWFSWSNGIGVEDNIKKRIDKIRYNEPWLNSYIESEVKVPFWYFWPYPFDFILSNGKGDN